MFYLQPHSDTSLRSRLVEAWTQFLSRWDLAGCRFVSLDFNEPRSVAGARSALLRYLWAVHLVSGGGVRVAVPYVHRGRRAGKVHLHLFVRGVCPEVLACCWPYGMASVHPRPVSSGSDAPRYLAHAEVDHDCGDEGGGIQFDLVFLRGRDLVDRVVCDALREAGGPLTLLQLSLRLQVRVDGQTYRADASALQRALRRLALSGADGTRRRADC